MNRTILLLIITFSFTFKPITITWKLLADVQFEDKYSTKEEAYYYYPHFGKSVKELNGKEVEIKGFMLPINPSEGIYILLRYPYASCFFCGNGGPESVIEIKFNTKHRKYKYDDVVTLSGTLRLNKEDPYTCNYVLENAKEID